MASRISFEDPNSGSQIGVNNGPITNHFYMYTKNVKKIEAIPCDQTRAHYITPSLNNYHFIGRESDINTRTSPDMLASPFENLPSNNDVTSDETYEALSRPGGPQALQRTSCAVRHCHCSCHTTENSLGRYFGLEYTPLRIVFGRCDNDKCDMKRVGYKFRVAFNKLRIPLALLVDFEVIFGTGKYSIRPALSLQRVVNYTSPGFEILWKCQNHFISLVEAQNELQELNRSLSPLRQHVNPNGENYIQALLCHGPWGNQDDQFALVVFFVDELGMKLDNEDNKFLTRCVSWIGEGRHLNLLGIILELGFDPWGIDSPLFRKWPLPCSPGWISEEFTPDPFFLEYLAVLAKNNPGFGGSTPLQDAILCGSATTVGCLLLKTTNLESHRNFLGQTPLHLAVCNPKIFKLILKAGHDLNVIDRWGITPLMYAAALGVSEVVQLLIIKGADIVMRATNWDRDFMAYAAVRGHWDLILQTLNTIRSCYVEEASIHYGNKAILHLVFKVNWLRDARTKNFGSLLELCMDVNFTFEDGCRGTKHNNLLHYVKNEEELHVLLRLGFHGFNVPNSDGQLPIFSIAHHTSNSKLIQSCIDNGTDINHIDHNDRTIIFELLPRLSRLYYATWDTIDSIKLCLDRELDIFHADDCRCACSPSGCHTSSVFDLHFTSVFYKSQPDFIWAFEWLSIIEESCGYEASKTMLLSFIRRTRFDILKLTHVCCHRGEGLRPGDMLKRFCSTPGVVDIEHALSMEQDMIEELEQEMQSYIPESLDALKCLWIELFKKEYEGVLKKSKARMKRPSKVSRYIDYKNDTYIIPVDIGSPVIEYNLANSLSNYMFWLQHEYLRRLDYPEDTLMKEGWYMRRICWFSKLMNAMGISAQKTKQAMERINLEETRSERIDRKAVVEQFWISMKVNLLVDLADRRV